MSGAPEPWSEADVERTAEYLWRAEVADLPVADRARQKEVWADQTPAIHEKWRRMARAALTASLSAGLLAEVREALEPFADVDGEGSEDFPDDTKVTAQFGRTTHYAITLGDFRRARALLARLDGGKP